jgi:acetylornithine deacetylase
MSTTPSGAEPRVLEAIDRLEPAYRSLLQALVRIPSTVGEEAEAQALVSRHMREIGLTVDSFDIDAEALRPLAAFNPSPRNYAGRPCVVGRMSGTGGGRSLLLNAHIDTVPVDTLNAWTYRRMPVGGARHQGRRRGTGRRPHRDQRD